VTTAIVVDKIPKITAKRLLRESILLCLGRKMAERGAFGGQAKAERKREGRTYRGIGGVEE